MLTPRPGKLTSGKPKAKLALSGVSVPAIAGKFVAYFTEGKETDKNRIGVMSLDEAKVVKTFILAEPGSSC